MEISILGRKVNVEVLLLIGIVYLIMLVHAIIPCTNMPLLYESMTTMTSPAAAAAKNKVPSSIGTAGKKEGFSSGYGAYNLNNASPYKLGDYAMPNVSNWFQPNLTVTPGQPVDAGVKSILDRPAQPVPLPEGELLLFANTEFSPDACPNTYSNSMGCAKMTVQQYNYLQTRGGNNVPYSEY